MSYTLRTRDKEYSCRIEDSKLFLKENGESTLEVDVTDIITIGELDRGDGNTGKFSLHTINKSRSPKWRKSVITLSGENDVCSNFAGAVNEAINAYCSSMPKRLLVMINPIGGKQTGVKSYNNVVAPIFKLADITTDVIVSERPKHVIDVMNSYDFTNTDGIVLCGGDGTYHECVDTLMKRFQKEVGADINDMDADIKPLPIPIGMIPTGTGNVIAIGNYGIPDIETAALHIIRGQLKKRCVIGFYEDNKLLSYAAQSFSYGMFTEMLHSMNTNRWLKGRIKMVIPLYHMVIKRLPLFRAEIVYRKRQNSENTNDKPKEHNQDTNTGTAQLDENDIELEKKPDQEFTEFSSSDQSYGRIEGSYHSVISFIDDMSDDEFTNHGKLLDSDCTTLMMYTTGGRMQLASHMFKLMQKDPDALKFDFLHNIKITGFKFKLLKETNANLSQEQIPLSDRRIALDGEVIELQKPEFECRWHKGIVPVFSGYCS